MLATIISAHTTINNCKAKNYSHKSNKRNSENAEWEKSFSRIEYHVMQSNYSKVVDKIYKSEASAIKYAQKKGLDPKKAVKGIFVK